MGELVHVARSAGVLSISLDRADAGNRLTNGMADALTAAFDAAGDAGVIVLRASGPDFCLGRDMEPPAPGSRVTPADVLRDDAAPIVAMYDALRRLRQPLVGVVQGRAWGIGLVLAAVCDYTLAAEDANFRLRELERGIPPCIAMAPLLDRIPAKAIGALVYSAEEQSAAWALAAGLVSKLVPADRLQAACEDLCTRLLGFSPQAVQAVKQYLCTAPRGDENAAVQYGASLLANVLASR